MYLNPALVMTSLKQGASAVDRRTWGLVIGLYPHLVRATVTTAKPVAASLQQVRLLLLLLLLLLLQALQQYGDLLQPPAVDVGSSTA